MTFLNTLLSKINEVYLTLVNANDWTKMGIVVAITVVVILLHYLAKRKMLDFLKPIVREASNIFTEQQEDAFLKFVVEKAFVVLPFWIKTFVGEQTIIDETLKLYDNLEQWGNE